VVGGDPADVARELATDATWRRLLHDPTSGELLDVGRTTYRPPAALAEFITPTTPADTQTAPRTATILTAGNGVG